MRFKASSLLHRAPLVPTQRAIHLQANQRWKRQGHPDDQGELDAIKEEKPKEAKNGCAVHQQNERRSRQRLADFDGIRQAAHDLAGVARIEKLHAEPQNMPVVLRHQLDIDFSADIRQAAQTLNAHLPIRKLVQFTVLFQTFPKLKGQGLAPAML